MFCYRAFTVCIHLGLGSILGVVTTAVMEIVQLAYTIYQAKKKLDEGVLIKSRMDFIKVVIDAIFLALSRCGASIGGMFIGQLLIPVPVVGGLIGMLVGTLVGHFGGKVIGLCSPYLASGLDKHLKEN